MKITKQLLISLMLVMSACTPATAERPAKTTTAPETTATALQNSSEVTTTPTTREQPDESGERVEFEPGIATTTRSGVLAEGGYKKYVLAASAGQRIQIQTVGYDAPIHFTLRNYGGDTWSGEPQASGVYLYAVRVVLPEDGDYLVMLSTPLDMAGTRYDITFTLEDIWQPSEPPERVEFTNETNSAQISGLLPSGLTVKQYVLAAKEGQILTVNFVSDDVPISLTLTSPSGMLLFSEILQANGSSSGGNVHKLVETGDYLITLTKADHTPSTHYTMDFTIQFGSIPAHEKMDNVVDPPIRH